MSDQPQTIEELYREAQADLARGGTAVALKWAFKHARAVERATRAELAHKAHDADRFRMQLQDTSSTDAIEALVVATQTMYAGAVNLAAARAAEAACAHVQRIAETMPKLERPPARAPQPSPTSKPASAPAGKRAA